MPLLDPWVRPCFQANNIQIIIIKDMIDDRVFVCIYNGPTDNYKIQRTCVLISLSPFQTEPKPTRRAFFLNMLIKSRFVAPLIIQTISYK